MNDPVEAIVARALDDAGISYTRPDGTPDFKITAFNLEIEVKQFYSERVIRQLEGKENIILIQGKPAASYFYRLLNGDHQFQRGR